LRFNQDVARYLTSGEITPVLEGALGPGYRVSYVTGYVTGPGRERDIWHADWPFNQRNSVHIPAPYPDFCAHLTVFFMLTDFRPENGATFLLPGSHKHPDHPRPGGAFGDWLEPKEGEVQLLGNAGDCGICDSRLWHAVSPNVAKEERVAVVVRYAAWWLNLNPTRRLSAERTLMTIPESYDTVVEDLPPEVYDTLPEAVKPLVKHLLPFGQQVV
jgi:ectoine hydroxylase-related dioxygenase (phytanoyl-CoA dioxygenase family)